MSYQIGGWGQSLSDQPPSTFSYTMYGMVTNLAGLTTGTPSAPGWSPKTSAAPNVAGEVMWTYGGGGCQPNNYPETQSQVDEIVSATRSQNWAGVDFDDECSMNVDHIIRSMIELRALSLQTSYTFLAGWDYNNPSASSYGQSINDAVKNIQDSNACQRFDLMCYAAAMWSISDIEANVGPAIDRTININGVPAKKVFLALTPAGLNDVNLNYFLEQVIQKDIGGLFIWNYPSLSNKDLEIIEKRLGIT